MNRYDTNGNGTLPGGLTWSQLCNFIRNIEDGIDGSGPSFLDTVRMSWITNLAHNLRTSGKDRAAVKKFGRRAATVWGIPDSSMLIVSTGLNHLPPKESQEIAQEELAQIAIDLIRAKAAADDQLNLPNYKDRQYIQATTSALTTIMGSVDPVSETSSKPLGYDNAREILHADAENEPSIEEILLKLKKDEDLSE
jgi:hypothetical protein